EHAVEFAAAGGFEGRSNFGRVMAVVIDHRNVVNGTLDVEAAADSAKVGESLADELDGNIEIKGDSSGSGRIADIVDAGRMREAKKAEILPLVGEAEFAGEAAKLDIADKEVGLARCAIGKDGAFDVGNDGLNVGFIEAEDSGAVERDSVNELRKGVLNVSERSVLVQVLAVDGRNHSDYRRKKQKATIAFVGFDDEVFAFAKAS